MGTEKIKVRTMSAQVAQDEFDRYEALAKLRGMTVSAFIREAMQVLYPAELFEEQKANLHEQYTAESPTASEPSVNLPNTQSVMGFGNMYGGLDDTRVLSLEDGLHAAAAVMDSYETGRSPTNAASSRTQLPSVPQFGGPAVPNAQHPCRFLDPRPPVNLTRVDCQGSCKAQHGRPCHWAANVAHDCASYQPMRTGPFRVI